MATITINTAETIEFRDAQPNLPPDASFVTAQLGKWALDNSVETGIIVDASGPDTPPTVLSANNARKLAKWLTRAADELDAAGGTKATKKRHYYEQDDDEYGLRPGK